MDVGNLSYLVTRGFTKRKLTLLLAIVCLSLLTTGCLCLSFGGGCEGCGGGEHTESSGVLTQKGSLPKASGEPVTVYYPVPYASPPNLELRDPLNKCRIIDQRADSFRIVQDGPGMPDVNWTARGVKSTSPAASLPIQAIVAQPPANEPTPVVPTGFSR